MMFFFCYLVYLIKVLIVFYVISFISFFFGITIQNPDIILMVNLGLSVLYLVFIDDNYILILVFTEIFVTILFQCI